MRALACLSLAFALLAAGCGFQLRGTAELPFDTVFVPGSGGIALEMKRSIQAGTRTTVVEDAKRAAAVLDFTLEARQKEILSLTAGGRVREFRLLYRVAFRVHDGKGGDFVPPSTLQLAREFTYTDAQLLAKEIEEQSLYRDMQADMVQQILRRLAAAQKPQ